MTALTIPQFHAIADQACKAIDLWSPAAVNLVTMTACHESQLQFRRQFGNGPALGLCQMEPGDWIDIQVKYLAFQPELAAKVKALAGTNTPTAETMVDNDIYAAAMCRVHYRRAKPPLPAALDSDGMAGYWKQFYNTTKGAGTVEQFKTSFIRLALAGIATGPL